MAGEGVRRTRHKNGEMKTILQPGLSRIDRQIKVEELKTMRTNIFFTITTSPSSRLFVCVCVLGKCVGEKYGEGKWGGRKWESQNTGQ